MTPEQAEDLAEIARQTATSLVARVHVEPPEVIFAHLARLSPMHLFATTAVLAAMVPLAADPDELLAWLEDESTATVLHTQQPTTTPTTDRTEPVDLSTTDTHVDTDTDEVEAPSDTTREAAQRVVATHATDAGDRDMLLAMLGLDQVAEVAA